jgi:hypothetical protein
MNETPQEPSSDVPVPQADLGWMQTIFEGNRQRNFFATQRSSRVEVVGPPLPFASEVFLQAAIILTGDRTQEGILVVAIAWEERDSIKVYSVPSSQANSEREGGTNAPL